MDCAGKIAEKNGTSVPKMLWLAISFSVRVDGALCGRSPDYCEGLRTALSLEINDDGIIRHARVTQDAFAHICTPPTEF